MNNDKADFTQGSILKKLIAFMIPVLGALILQAAYGAVDLLVVGRFGSTSGLSAVSTGSQVLNLVTFVVIQFAMGITVLIARYLGEKKPQQIGAVVGGASIVFTLISAVLFVVMVFFARPIAILMQAPEEAVDLTASYIRICGGGIFFIVAYNLLSAIFRGLGDSQSPLYFLITSAVINILGDLFFVLFLNMGSEGCAVSTVLSEALSCLLCIIYIQKKVPILQLGKKWLVFDKALLGKTISYGWASAMQQATVQLGKLGIQAIVNSMGVSIAAAFAVVNRIDDFAYTPEQNIGHAMTALMAQSRGAGKIKRLKDAFKCGIRIEFVYGLLIFAVCFFFASPLMGLFSKDPEVCSHGVIYLRLISFMYLLPAATNGIQGYFRGIGDLKITLISSIVNMVVRVIAAVFLVFGFSLQIEALPYSYLAGWIGMLVAELPLLIKSYRQLDA